MKKYLKMLFVALFAIISVLGANPLSAESADYAKLVPPSTIAAGEDAEFVLHITGEDIYGINGVLTYDTKLMTYIDASIDIGATWESSINQTDGTVYFALADGKYNLSADGKNVITFRFKISDSANVETLSLNAGSLTASKKGKTLSLNDAVFEMASRNNDTGTDNSGGNTVTVVTETDKTANNNYLKSLTVKNAEISPDFDRAEQKYEAKVKYDIKKLDVVAEAEAENATVNIIDTELKYIGKNIVRVQVISESGLKRTYKIYVTRSAKQATAPAVDGGLPAYAIILICVGGCLLAAALVLMIIFIKRMKKQKQ